MPISPSLIFYKQQVFISLSQHTVKVNPSSLYPFPFSHLLTIVFSQGSRLLILLIFRFISRTVECGCFNEDRRTRIRVISVTPAVNVRVKVIGLNRGVMWFIPLEENNHISTSPRPINGLFLHWRGLLKGCNNTLKTNASIFHLSFVFQHWHWWDSQVSRLFNYVTLLKSHFDLAVLLVRSEC